MNTITIRNIGPIKKVSLELNKINVIIGPQSSGKSTIAKIISYCTWVEKDVATSQSLDDYRKNGNYFRERLESFHKIKGYFKSNTYISYESDIVNLKYDAGLFTIEWVDQFAYKRSKISYMPSERNMVTLPEVEKVEFGNVYERSFLFDWFDARKNYPKEKKLPILNLEVDYYFVENIIKEDHISGKNGNEEYDILLSNASSGLQSITPLVAVLDYLINWFYKKEDNTSFLQEDKQRKVSNFLIDEKILKPYFSLDSISKNERKERIEEINEKIRNNDPKARKFLIDYRKQVTNLFSTHNTQFIIEEPEQNLFPLTQRDLIYFLLEKCLDKTRDHRLTLTTHSPYILYALNNCMMGGLVYEKMTEKDKSRIKCKSAIINPNKVSVYEIHNGELKNIQQKDRLIGANYFDNIMKELMDDFYIMLNYYA